MSFYDPGDSLYDVDHSAIDDALAGGTEHFDMGAPPESGPVGGGGILDPSAGYGSGFDSTGRRIDATGAAITDPSVPGTALARGVTDATGTPITDPTFVDWRGNPAATAGRPLTAEERLFQNQHPNGGSFVNPNPGSGLTIEQQNALPNGGSLSASGGLPNVSPVGGTAGSTASAGGTGNWNADWKAHMGWDPIAAYNGKENFLHNAQEGDRTVRGGALAGGSGVDQLAEMAKYDADAKRVYDAINAVGMDKFYRSEMATTHAGLHNASIADQANRLANGQGIPELGIAPGAAGGGGRSTNTRLGEGVKQAVGTGNQALFDQLRSWAETVPANPVSNSEAFGLQMQMAKDLATLGATGIHARGTDLYYTDAGGKVQAILSDKPGQPIALSDWVDKAAALHRAVEAMSQQAAQPQGNGYGGYGGNNRYGGRSTGGYGGGGNTGTTGAAAGITITPPAPEYVMDGVPQITINGKQPGSVGVPTNATAARYTGQQRTNYLNSPSYDLDLLQQAGYQTPAYSYRQGSPR